MSEYEPDILSAPPDAPVVKWMERPSLGVGPAGLTGALAGAFMLGMLVAVAAMAVGRLLESDDDDEAVVLRRIR
jgi:hypothetical protein